MQWIYSKISKKNSTPYVIVQVALCIMSSHFTGKEIIVVQCEYIIIHQCILTNVIKGTRDHVQN